MCGVGFSDIFLRELVAAGVRSKAEKKEFIHT